MGVPSPPAAFLLFVCCQAEVEGESKEKNEKKKEKKREIASKAKQTKSKRLGQPRWRERARLVGGAGHGAGIKITLVIL